MKGIMDINLQSIIYIIVIIIFFVYRSIARSKRKDQEKGNKWDFLTGEPEIIEEESFNEKAFENDNLVENPLLEGKEDIITEERKVEELTKLLSVESKKEESEEIKKEKESRKSVKSEMHSKKEEPYKVDIPGEDIIENMSAEFDLEKAVIYSEILNRKYC